MPSWFFTKCPKFSPKDIRPVCWPALQLHLLPLSPIARSALSSDMPGTIYYQSLVVLSTCNILFPYNFRTCTLTSLRSPFKGPFLIIQPKNGMLTPSPTTPAHTNISLPTLICEFNNGVYCILFMSRLNLLQTWYKQLIVNTCLLNK